MAVSETDTSDCNSDSSADGTKSSDKNRDRHFTKVVTRRLPPSMNKESFLNQIDPLPESDYLYFVKADLSLGEHAFSRAYINFKNTSDVFIFKEKFDNYVFLDSKGNEYPAVVEFAPFSRIPKKRNTKRLDPKCGTIDTDPIYIEFIESLNQVTTETEEKPEYCFQPAEEQKIVNTPLLDFIKQRRIDRQKIKEEKREERKRRDIERKRIKDDKSSSRKITPTKPNKSLDIIEEKFDASPKGKDYRSRNGKPSPKEYEKRSFTSRDYRETTTKKSPPKIRQRNLFEKDARRTEFKRRDEKPEKRVKKYSERREERKNEFKKQELKTTDIENDDEKLELSEKMDHRDEVVDAKDSEKIEATTSKDSEKETVKREVKSQSRKDEKYDAPKEYTKREKDPRTQRRIRNKDRPTMAIYQPGIFRKRQQGTDNSDDGQKCSGSDTNKSQ